MNSIIMTESDSAKSVGKICYGILGMFAPPNSYAEILNTKDDCIRGEVFGWCLDNEGGALTNAIGAFINEALERSFALSIIQGHGKKATSCEPEREPLPESDHVSTLTLDFQTSRTVGNILLLSIN